MNEAGEDRRDDRSICRSRNRYGVRAGLGRDSAPSVDKIRNAELRHRWRWVIASARAWMGDGSWLPQGVLVATA